MQNQKSSPIIAILNGAEDLLDIMEEYLREEGFLTVAAVVSDFKKGRRSFPEFIRKFNPAVVLYDVPPPYEENMNFFRLLMDTRSVDERCIIFTTTNVTQLEKLTGEKAALEIVGKPFDMNLLVKAVREKLENCCKAA